MPSILQFIVFLTIVISTFGGLHYYFYNRLVKNAGLSNFWRRVGLLVILGLALITILAMPLSRLLPLNVSRGVTMVPFIWMGTTVILLFCILIADSARLVVFAARKIGRKKPLDRALKQRINRLVSLVSVVITLILGGIAVGNGLGNPRVRNVEVVLDRLDPVFDGLTIVQLTDLHIGPTLGREWLGKVVDRVNGLKPDVVVITGDMVDGEVARLERDVAPLSRIKAPQGKFFVTGNHEYFSGALEWVKAVERLGLAVLSDTHAVIEKEGGKLVVAGVDDFRRGEGEPQEPRDLRSVLRALKFDTTSEAVLLLHNPRNILDIKDERFGLVLTGHTHGGQIWPFTYLVRIAHPYLSGMYDHKGRTQVYVSEGTGFWGPPLRLGTRGEITHLTLRTKAFPKTESGGLREP